MPHLQSTPSTTRAATCVSLRAHSPADSIRADPRSLSHRRSASPSRRKRARAAAPTRFGSVSGPTRRHTTSTSQYRRTPPAPLCSLPCSASLSCIFLPPTLSPSQPTQSTKPYNAHSHCFSIAVVVVVPSCLFRLCLYSQSQPSMDFSLRLVVARIALVSVTSFDWSSRAAEQLLHRKQRQATIGRRAAKQLQSERTVKDSACSRDVGLRCTSNATARSMFEKVSRGSAPPSSRAALFMSEMARFFSTLQTTRCVLADPAQRQGLSPSESVSRSSSRPTIVASNSPLGRLTREC